MKPSSRTFSVPSTDGSVPSSDLDPKPLIVIGRQTGSGGRSVGRIIAERLGVRYLDKELMRECAERSGYSPEIFALADEKRPPLFRAFLSARFGLGVSSPISREELYGAQANVIRSIAAEGDAVFVGRTADYILRDHPRLFRVFLHAPIDHRADRLVRSGEFRTHEEALAHIRRSDSGRQGYYNYFTPNHWGEATNYDVTINSAGIPDESLADLILTLAKEKLKGGKSRNS